MDLLGAAECELDALSGKGLLELVEIEADLLELFIGGRTFGESEGVAPNKLGFHDIEDETAEEAVFSIGNEIEHLLRRS